MRQDASGHTYSDTVAAQHQQTWQFGGQDHRFDLSAVIVGNECGDVIVEHRFVSEFGQTAFGVTSGGGGAAGEDIAEVSLLHDEVGDVQEFSFFLSGLAVAVTVFDHAALVGKDYQRISNGSVAVGVIVHGVAHDIGDLLGASVVDLVERPENTALNRFESVIHIGNGAGTDDVTGIVEEVPVDHLAEVIVGTLLLLGEDGGIVFLIRDLNGILNLGIKFVTHNPRPPNCS